MFSQTLARARRRRPSARNVVGDALEGAVRDRQEERLLGAEQAHDVRLRDACALGDAVGRRAVEATARELDRGCRRDLRAPLVGCVPCRFLDSFLDMVSVDYYYRPKVVIDQ